MTIGRGRKRARPVSTATARGTSRSSRRSGSSQAIGRHLDPAHAERVEASRVARQEAGRQHAPSVHSVEQSSLPEGDHGVVAVRAAPSGQSRQVAVGEIELALVRPGVRQGQLSRHRSHRHRRVDGLAGGRSLLQLGLFRACRPTRCARPAGAETRASAAAATAERGTAFEKSPAGNRGSARAPGRRRGRRDPEGSGPSVAAATERAAAEARHHTSRLVRSVAPRGSSRDRHWAERDRPARIARVKSNTRASAPGAASGPRPHWRARQRAIAAAKTFTGVCLSSSGSAASASAGAGVWET